MILKKKLKNLKVLDLKLKLKRLDERVNFDLEMIKELGYSGIGNYSRYFDGRATRVQDHSVYWIIFQMILLPLLMNHMLHYRKLEAMYGGDKSRKTTLVDHGFRLPSTLDNRPLKFEEWELMNKQRNSL